jgi:hypothetical protein
MITALLALAMCGQQLDLVDRDGSTTSLTIDPRIATPIRYTDAARVLIVHTDRDHITTDSFED